MRVGVALAIAVSVCVLAPSAGMCEAAWQSIHTAGDPKITMDIPAGLHQETSVNPKKGQLMAFFASAGDDDLECFLIRNRYSSKMTQKPWAAAMVQSVSTFCEMSGANISQGAALESQATTSNGFPAGTCASTYTDSKEKKPGTVRSNMTIAAPKVIYTLTCVLSAEDQGMAAADWNGIWKDDIVHMQESLHLPDSDK